MQQPSAIGAIGSLLGVLFTLALSGFLLFIAIDAWAKLRSIAKATQSLADRAGVLDQLRDIDLDAWEAVLYLRALHARAEGSPPDIAEGLEEIVRLRRERERK